MRLFFLRRLSLSACADRKATISNERPDSVPASSLLVLGLALAPLALSAPALALSALALAALALLSALALVESSVPGDERGVRFPVPSDPLGLWQRLLLLRVPNGRSNAHARREGEGEA